MQANYLARPMMTYQSSGEPVPILWAILPIVAFVFVLWQTIGLFQLRRFNRWFAVVFFLWWTIALVWNAMVVLGRPTAKWLPAIAGISVIATFNLLSAWYVARRSFREFAIQFVAERDKEKHSREMQKASQKKILDDIRSRWRERP